MGHTAPCDKDCFHCKFPDCIWDGHDYERQRAYREANKEKIAAQRRAYYEATKERIAAQQRAYREANKEKVAAQQEGRIACVKTAQRPGTTL